MSELEAAASELKTRNDELEKMLYENITKDMNTKKFVKHVGKNGSVLSPVADVLSKLTRSSGQEIGLDGAIRQGWLTKKGQLNTEWKRRWFVVKGGALSHRIAIARTWLRIGCVAFGALGPESGAQGREW
jgi:hypothetical protein